MNKYLKIISPLVFLLSLASILVFKTIPASKLWKEYTVLYVSSDTDNSMIMNILSNNGISDVVYLEGQYLPVSLPENSVEISMFKLNRDKPEYDYYIKRNAYFFDKSNNFRLYYIPTVFKSKIFDCISILNSKNINCGIDATSSYPWVIPVILALLIILLSLFSKNKILFFFSAIITLAYTLSNPYYSAALSCILLILILFFISNLWKRRDSFIFILNHLSIPSMVVISLICSFSISLKTGFFLLVTIICIASFIFTYYEVEEFIRNRKSFNPVLILSAKKVSIFAKKSNIVMPSLMIASIILIGVFFLTSSQSINSHFSKLLLPSAAYTENNELPQLEDYYKWIWNIKSYPYNSLNKPSNDFLVEYPRYSDENGFISESKDLLAYNQNFKENVFSEIDNLGFNSIEKVLKSEGMDFVAGYTSTSTYNANLFSVIMMIICFFILLFIYFYTIIKKEI